MQGANDNRIIPSMFAALLADPREVRNSPHLLLDALKKLNRLIEFNFDTTVDKLDDDAMLDEIISAVATAPFRLQHLSLWYQHIMTHRNLPDRKTPHVTPHLKSLTGLLLEHCDCSNCYPNPFYIALVSTPNLILRDVYLNIPRGTIPGIGDGSLEMSELLGRTHWPQLQRITLFYKDNLRTESQIEGLRAFLMHHTTLQVVCLPGGLLPNLPDDAITLPSLQSLMFGRRGMKETYRIPQRIAGNIRHFIVRIEGEGMLDALKDMKELRSCQISNVSNIAKLHDFSPFLERLLYTPSEESYDRAWNQPLKKIDPEIKKEFYG
ncbi:hypothetical protein M422DRAFT_52580 [Sphaerobolus stellatus SS14]|uniref:Uncharacterized protein n=1 Tax=Sphaerobolus stellatus (strain SS14) TaxID=990650 RepID=A0A0C9UV64_SPHS4|nr:hypothetical protein M422DRAFT_52580 [Sphaerobolus stellatus SS14]